MLIGFGNSYLAKKNNEKELFTVKEMSLKFKNYVVVVVILSA